MLKCQIIVIVQQKTTSPEKIYALVREKYFPNLRVNFSSSLPF